MNETIMNETILNTFMQAQDALHAATDVTFAEAFAAYKQAEDDFYAAGGWAAPFFAAYGK